MSFWLEDRRGYLGDFATHGGVREMLALPGAHPALDEFIRSGEADAVEIERILREIGTIPALTHVSQMLRSAQPPVMISDGIEEE